MLEGIEFKVYFSAALYPEGAFEINEYDDDEYDFAEDREEKFNEYLVVGDKVPFIITQMTNGCNWNTEDDVHMTKISYKENGTFVAQIYFKEFSEDDLLDDFMLNDIINTYLWPGEERGVYIDINGEYFELDIEIEDIQEINKYDDFQDLESNLDSELESESESESESELNSNSNSNFEEELEDYEEELEEII